MDHDAGAMDVAEIITNTKDALPKQKLFKSIPESDVIVLSTSSDESTLTTPKDKAPMLKIAPTKTEKPHEKFEALSTVNSVIDLCSSPKKSPSWIIRRVKRTIKTEPRYPKVETPVSSKNLMQYMQQLQKINTPKIMCKHCKKTLVPKGSKHIGPNEVKYYRGGGIYGNVMHRCSEVNKMVARSIKKPYRFCKKGCQGSCFDFRWENKGVFAKSLIGLPMRNTLKVEDPDSYPSTPIKKEKSWKMSYGYPYGYYVSYQNGDKIEKIPLFTTVSIPYNGKRRARKMKKKAKGLRGKTPKYCDYGMLKCNHCEGIFTKQRGDGYRQYQTCSMKNSTQHLCTATDRGTKQIWRSLDHPWRGCTLGCKKSCVVRITSTDEPWID